MYGVHSSMWINGSRGVCIPELGCWVFQGHYRQVAGNTCSGRLWMKVSQCRWRTTVKVVTAVFSGKKAAENFNCGNDPQMCSVLGLSAVLKPAEFSCCSWWWLIFSAEVPHWGTKPCSLCSLTWWNHCTKKRWREGSGGVCPVGRRFGSMGVRCDVAQV